MPNVPEYPKEELLAFEKEILGVYVSGHPLEEYLDLWKNSVTAQTIDFAVDEETGHAKVADNSRVTIGGMITAKTVKITKTGQQMAFLTVEDMVGSVEVLVFREIMRVREHCSTRTRRSLFRDVLRSGMIRSEN